jgi:hypothetical protein
MLITSNPAHILELQSDLTVFYGRMNRILGVPISNLGLETTNSEGLYDRFSILPEK